MTDESARVNVKPSWQSRTLWFNAVLGVGMAVESQLGLLKPFMGEANYAGFAIALIAGNAVLRVITSTALRL